eukprot:s381_g6.t1
MQQATPAAACGDAFAAILADDSVATGTAARMPLQAVQRVRSCRYAFTAIFRDGSVLTWGDARPLHDLLSSVEPELASEISLTATQEPIAQEPYYKELQLQTNEELHSEQA